jgi:hypothetical protein
MGGEILPEKFAASRGIAERLGGLKQANAARINDRVGGNFKAENNKKMGG